MNLLGFLAIVIAVTGMVWLLQMIFKGKDRIDINLSVGRSPASSLENPTRDGVSKKHPSSIPHRDKDSILDEVGSVGDKIHLSSTPTTNSSVSADPIVETPHLDSTQSTFKDEDAYLDQVLDDELFEEHTNESLLREVTDGQLTPPTGHLTFSGFGSLVAQLPADSFDKPQSSEQIEAMFAVLRESTRRIEQQMIALYEVHRSKLAPQIDSSPAISVEPESQSENESDDYSFNDDDDEPTVVNFGGGIDSVLTPKDSPEYNVDSEPTTELISMEELGLNIPDDAFQTHDMADVLEPSDEIRKEALPYLASLNKTGELSYEVVSALKRKATSREVKHRVRQVLRAIDHFDLSGDANAALRVTAVFRHLPEDLGEFDNDIAAIGRRFGLIEPQDDPTPVEVDEAING